MDRNAHSPDGGIRNGHLSVRSRDALVGAENYEGAEFCPLPLPVDEYFDPPKSTTRSARYPACAIGFSLLVTVLDRKSVTAMAQHGAHAEISQAAIPGRTALVEIILL